VDWIFVAFSGLILTGFVFLQKSLGDIAGDEAELSAIAKTNPEKGPQKKSFLKKRKNQ
jgi:hypothetical protein